jgi:hypothetical protein
MHFNPRIIGADDDGTPSSGPTEPSMRLPDDLALLGEQLADDAAYLAAVYRPKTANRPNTVYWPKTATPASAKNRMSKKRAGLFAVVSAAAALVVAVGVWRAADSPEPADFAAADNADTLERHQAGTVPVASVGGSHAAPVAFVQASVRGAEHVDAEPAIWFYELSTPEQEALLDLWEEEAPKKRELSF